MDRHRHELDNDILNTHLMKLGQLVVTEEPVSTALARVAEMASSVIDVCDCCGVSLVQGDHVETRAASDDRADDVDEMQYSAGSGPCLQAIEDGRAVNVASFDDESRWPEFIQRARAAGIRASYSVPLTVDDDIVGSINYYSASSAFDPRARHLGDLFATQAAVALHNARTFSGVRDLVGQLREALESRDVIGQAKGILMARHGIDAEAAFDRLRTESQHRNQKLRTIAARLVEEASDVATHAE